MVSATLFFVLFCSIGFPNQNINVMNSRPAFYSQLPLRVAKTTVHSTIYGTIYRNAVVAISRIP